MSCEEDCTDLSPIVHSVKLKFLGMNKSLFYVLSDLLHYHNQLAKKQRKMERGREKTVKDSFSITGERKQKRFHYLMIR